MLGKPFVFFFFFFYESGSRKQSRAAALSRSHSDEKETHLWLEVRRHSAPQDGRPGPVALGGTGDDHQGQRAGLHQSRRVKQREGNSVKPQGCIMRNHLGRRHRSRAGNQKPERGQGSRLFPWSVTESFLSLVRLFI